MATIAVIDYDMGNLHSACKGLEFAGATPIITNEPAQIQAAAGVVLPGVGAFDPAMQHLRALALVDPIHQAIAAGKPFLGICLGMQLLFERSEEGSEPGLGVLEGEVRRFTTEPGIAIPHMGWNRLEFTQPDCPLWHNLPAEAWVYFVHSYYAVPRDSRAIAATVQHGSQRVTAAIASGNVMAVQFHPEKSAAVGLKLLSNFVAVVCQRTVASCA